MTSSPSSLRAVCVLAALLFFGAACSGDDDPATEGTAERGQQETPAPTSDPATADTPTAPDEQEPEFAACAWDRRLPVPLAADVDELATKWNAAVASVAPEVLTPFDVSTAYSVTDDNRTPDGGANYVGDRAFLVATWRTDNGVDAASLLVGPDSPVIDSAVRTFVTAILGPEVPLGAVDQVIDSLTLWPDRVASDAVVHSCFWSARTQPLSTDEDDVVYILDVVAAETALSVNDDVARWLRADASRTVGTLFVRDASRWNGQSDE